MLDSDSPGDAFPGSWQSSTVGHLSPPAPRRDDGSLGQDQGWGGPACDKPHLCPHQNEKIDWPKRC